MVFFELVNIEQMLDTTHDPIADFINSLTADVIAFSAIRSYEEFLGHVRLGAEYGWLRSVPGTTALCVCV